MSLRKDGGYFIKKMFSNEMCRGAGIIGNIGIFTDCSLVNIHLMLAPFFSGQPYAFRQAGLATAIVLLVSLTVVVCS